MKRGFTGPFWLLLIFGLLLLPGISIYLHVFFGSGLHASGRPVLSGFNLLKVFMWPMIFLLEALVYWLIRRRNGFRSLSWAHSEQLYLYRGLVILAHLAFVAVLANCLRKAAPAIMVEGQGQENLLDDVML